MCSDLDVDEFVASYEDIQGLVATAFLGCGFCSNHFVALTDVISAAMDARSVFSQSASFLCIGFTITDLRTDC